MTSLSIGEVARQVGLTPSALRYYERVGLVPPPPRSSKRRIYDAKIIGRVRLVMLARDAGFSVRETLAFVADYPAGAMPSARWRLMAERKIAELDALTKRVSRMKAVLNDSFRCECRELRECERLIAAKHERKKRGGMT